MTAPTRWLVISPHLDDAVFSCRQLLAQAPGSVVVTVFAGIPWILRERRALPPHVERMRRRLEDDARRRAGARA